MMEQTPRQIAREMAIICIYQKLLYDATMDDFELYLKEEKILNENEKYYNFAFSLVTTTVKNLEQYKNEIKKYIKKSWSFERLNLLERAVLLVSTCELLDFDMDKQIVINEAVLFCKKYCDEDSYKFVNGILAKVI